MVDDKGLQRTSSEILVSSISKPDSFSRELSISSPVPRENSLITNDSGDFFIEDDDEDTANHALLNPFKTAVSQRSVASTTSATATSTTITNPGEVGDLKTGLVFEAALDHADPQNPLHKERAIRVTSIQETLREAGFEDRCTFVLNAPTSRVVNDTRTSNEDDSDDDVTPEVLFLQDEDYLRVHLPGYMKRLDSLSGCNCQMTLDRESQQYSSIYFTKSSTMAAKKAAASLCHLVSKVVQGTLDNGFAVIRPPGHHAEPGVAGGYSIINNVAVAAAYAREKLSVKKVLIVDWDVHHGNGTQGIFLKDPNVMYFSVHRWQGGNFYPFCRNGGPTMVGIEDGVGYNVNVGWNRKGMGDDEYEAVWEKVLMPMAQEFNPDLVLVSAGFDAADGDMGECHVSPECFGDLTRSLKRLADGKIVCTLEGGYVRSILGKCVTAVVDALLEHTTIYEIEAAAPDEESADILSEIDESAAKSIRATIAAHQTYWACFQ